MGSLKRFGIWGMVNLRSLPTTKDKNSWARGMKQVLQDPKAYYYFKKFTTECNIQLPQTQPEKLEHLHSSFMIYIHSL